MLSIIGIKKTIKQHTADMDITDSVDYKISAPPRFYNISTSSVIQGVPELAPQRKQANTNDNLRSKNANEEQLMTCIRQL
jgi:hypothetical protein